MSFGDIPFAESYGISGDTLGGYLEATPRLLLVAGPRQGNLPWMLSVQ
jgi:hypothetical protein